MNKLKCIIVDDEPIAQKIIEDYIKDYPELELVAKCNDVSSAFAALREHQVDLIFLDIQMPKNTGLDFVRSLSNPPKIIFTTAYPDYAVEGFEENAVDYLLKPVSQIRFAKAIHRVLVQHRTTQSSGKSEDPNESKWLIKSGGKTYMISIDEIYVITGMENYVKIICKDKEIVSLNTLGKLEKQFANTSLTRVHKSHIVNLSKMEYSESTSITVLGVRYLIGPSYRKDVFTKIKTLFGNLG